MIMASHQTFSGQLKHLTGQTKFGQSNILYIINGKVIKFLIEKPMSGQFSILIISTGCLTVPVLLVCIWEEVKISTIKLFENFLR